MNARVLALTIGVMCIDTSAHASDDLDLRVRTDDGALVITNREAAAVSDCWVQINSDYAVRDVALPPSQDVRLLLRRFAKKDGTRFNLFTHKIQGILVQCWKPKMRVGTFG